MKNQFSIGVFIFLVKSTSSQLAWNDIWIESVGDSILNVGSGTPQRNPILTTPEAPQVLSGSTVALLYSNASMIVPHVDCGKPKCCDVFAINEQEAGISQLITKVDLDFENTTFLLPNYNPDEGLDCQFMIAVTQQSECGSDPTQPCKPFKFKIENINDERPVYTEQPPFSVILIEENTMNSSMFTVKAEDREFPGQDLSILLYHSIEDFPFEFNPAGLGQEWTFGTTRSLDFESYRYYTMSVNVQDQPDRFGNVYTTEMNTTVTVQVVDQGDNRPQWVQICRLLEIEENFDPNGLVLFELRAQDIDTDIGNTLEYTIENVSNGPEDFTEQFEIVVSETDKIARVYAKNTLDRENIKIKENFNFQFQVQAKELGGCIENCTAKEPLTCYMRLQDVNDEIPSIENPIYTEEKYENFNGVIFDILITDLDQVDEGFDKFTVTIDDDEIGKHFDISPSQTQGQVQIRIQCIDDYLDFEQRESITFTLQATDKSNPLNTTAMLSTSQLTINLKDVNDNEPIFLESSYTREINEDLSELTEEDGKWKIDMEFSAMDDDHSPEFGNASLIFSLIDGPSQLEIVNSFQADKPVAYLYATSKFDYESQKSYSFEVKVEDNKGGLGTRINEALVAVTLNIKDVNDEAPTFTSTDENNCDYEIFNTQTEGSSLFTYTGDDEDQDGSASFYFTISESDEGFPCDIVSRDGLLYTLNLTKNLNEPEEVMGNFFYTVQITDEVGMSNSMECAIKVKDTNDNKPQFTYPHEGNFIWIKESAEPGALVDWFGDNVVVKATDADVDPAYNTITYDIDLSEEDVKAWFSINSVDGSFSLQNTLASFPAFTNDNEIQVQVQANDGGQDNNEIPSLSFVLKVEKDFPPEYDNIFRPIIITENHSVRESLQNATDRNNEEHPDGRPDQSICYFILDGNTNDTFELDVHTNILTNRTQIDRDCGTTCQSYTLLIAATNNCAEAPDVEDVDETGKQNLAITIKDENDNIPSFQNGSRSAGLSIDDKTDDRLLSLTVKDVDECGNSECLNISITSINVGIGSQGLPEGMDTFKLETKALGGILGGIYSIEVLLNFVPSGEMKGFFSIEITASDQDDQKSSTEIEIVMIALENVCEFSFSNSLSVIESKQEELISVFNGVFPYTFVIDRISADTNPTRAVKEDVSGNTIVRSHFVNSTTNQPILMWDAWVEFDRNLKQLLKDLATIEVSLRQFGTNFNPNNGSDVPIGTIILIISTVLFGLMFGFLLTAYCIRTNNLERKVKAMETVAEVETKDSKNDKIILTALQENVPGSNEFADEGANPIWQVAMESNDYDDEFKFDDNESVSSGDSILIGVEEQTDFTNYKDIDVDMDLYSKVKGKSTVYTELEQEKESAKAILQQTNSESEIKLMKESTKLQLHSEHEKSLNETDSDKATLHYHSEFEDKFNERRSCRCDEVQDFLDQLSRPYKTLDSYQAPPNEDGLFTMSGGIGGVSGGGGNPLYDSDEDQA